MSSGLAKFMAVVACFYLRLRYALLIPSTEPLLRTDCTAKIIECLWVKIPILCHMFLQLGELHEGIQPISTERLRSLTLSCQAHRRMGTTTARENTAFSDFLRANSLL